MRLKPKMGASWGELLFPTRSPDDAPQEQPRSSRQPPSIHEGDHSRSRDNREISGDTGEPIDQDYDLWIFGSVKSDIPIILKPV